MRTSDYFKTSYVILDTKNCKACWKCVENCSKQVIGKVDFFFHKHAKINNPENCSGCLKCMKVCENNAIKSI